MSAHDAPALPTLHPRIHSLAGDRPFSELLRLQGPCSEEALAAIIETDGRARLEKGLDASLETYLAAVPTLDQMTVALDAAIDMALRSLAGGSSPTAHTVETLIQRFPHLEPAIREAAMLGHALHTAAAPRKRSSRYAGQLPCDFGPTLPDGRPQYVLQKLLGRGAFGEVYLAQDRLLSDDDRPALAAIKVLADDPQNAALRYRLADEATKARRVDHPNVVRVIARARAASGEDFVVYEYVEGPNLQDHMRRLSERPTPRDAARLILQIARGVHAAHSAGLVHRDLKPGNILIDTAGRPRITDFGVAVRDRSGRSPESSDDAQAGTLAFMAPEQFSSRLGAVGPPADIFALGGILVWLITGRPPYGGTPEDITKSHLEASTGATPASLDEALRALHPALAHIARRALASKPDDRYASAAELANEILCWIDRRPVPSMGVPPHARLALWARRRPALAAVSALALLSATSGLAIALHLRDVARERESQAQIAQARLEFEEQRRQMGANAIGPYVQFIERVGKRDTPNAVGMLYMAHDMWGPQGINVGEMINVLTDSRMGFAERRIRDSRAPDGRPTLETAFWLSLATLWSIDHAHSEHSLNYIREARAFFQEHFPSDPWLRALDTLERCANANALLAAPSLDRPAALALLEALERDLTELDQLALFAPHNLARQTISRLRAPEALNLPASEPAPAASAN